MQITKEIVNLILKFPLKSGTNALMQYPILNLICTWFNYRQLS